MKFFEEHPSRTRVFIEIVIISVLVIAAWFGVKHLVECRDKQIAPLMHDTVKI